MGKKALPLENLKEIGKRLETLRTNLGLSQGKAALQLGISQQNLSRYESGIIEPTAGSLIALAGFYAVSVDFLLSGKDRAQPGPTTPEWLQPYLPTLDAMDERSIGIIIGTISTLAAQNEAAAPPGTPARRKAGASKQSGG